MFNVEGKRKKPQFKDLAIGDLFVVDGGLYRKCTPWYVSHDHPHHTNISVAKPFNAVLIDTNTGFAQNKFNDLFTFFPLEREVSPVANMKINVERV